MLSVFPFKASESQRTQDEKVLTEFFFKVQNKSKEETWLCQRVLVTRLNVEAGPEWGYYYSCLHGTKSPKALGELGYVLLYHESMKYHFKGVCFVFYFQLSQMLVSSLLICPGRAQTRALHKLAKASIFSLFSYLPCFSFKKFNLYAKLCVP